MYRKILVPLDGSDAAARALAPAAALALASDAIVETVSVVTPSLAADLRETASRQAEAAGIESPVITIVESHHSPVPRLIDALDEDPGSLLCLSTTGRSHMGQAMGSVAEELLRIRTGPFLLIGPECKNDAFAPNGPLLVPVDNSDTSHEVLPLAAAWSISYHLRPEVISVLDPSETGRGRAGTRGPDVGIESGVAMHAAKRIEHDIERPVGWEVLHSQHPADAIVERAQSLDAAAIAMTTHGKTGLARILVGSVSISVVHKATCPVLLHRPLRLRT